jgi:hypothetical protein
VVIVQDLANMQSGPPRHVAMPSRFFRFFRDELAEVVGCAHIGKEHFHPGICDAI